MKAESRETLADMLQSVREGLTNWQATHAGIDPAQNIVCVLSSDLVAMIREYMQDADGIEAATQERMQIVGLAVVEDVDLPPLTCSVHDLSAIQFNASER